MCENVCTLNNIREICMSELGACAHLNRVFEGV